MADWLNERMIYLARHGSQAYGTTVPDSDIDLRGIAVPPKAYFLGFVHTFEQTETVQPVTHGQPKTERVVFEIRKFMRLAADCNPNVLEILFVHPTDCLQITPAGEHLLAARSLFLSKKAKYTFSGYAIAQLKRIKSHRDWLLHPPSKPPVRSAYGLPEQGVFSKDQRDVALALIQKQVETWNIDLDGLGPAERLRIREKITETLTELHMLHEEDLFPAAGRQMGFSNNFMEVLDRERKYMAAQRTYAQYQEWLRTRNPARAALEAQHGYDCKHAMHLVRLLRMCKELLETGMLQVRRPDAEELLALRNGAWRYEDLMAWAHNQQQSIENSFVHSLLPERPNQVALDQLCMEVVEKVGW